VRWWRRWGGGLRQGGKIKESALIKKRGFGTGGKRERHRRGNQGGWKTKVYWWRGGKRRKEKLTS